ncbi:helix-turn-helix domain-containing protein [Streptomyces sp. NPDC050804]|uniref:TetR/AcrR family transcriptional regulator n=1 Tax=Streptomyces sp. NPDC050804 TaxID=3154745 RepID=UPI003412537D
MVLAAAREIFVEFGARVSLDDIARRAGVGNATLYGHFADRDTLIHDVMLSIAVRGADHAEMLVAEESDAFAAVSRFAHAAADQRVGILCGMFAMGTEKYAPDILAQRNLC